MLVPVVAFPVAPVPALTPLRRANRQAKRDKDRGGSRRESPPPFELGDPREAPSGNRAAATSSVAVLSALLDLPRGG